MTAILAQGLTKHYGRNRGIEDVSLAVERGEIFGFIGPNGAGKSTMIRTMMGMIFPERRKRYDLRARLREGFAYH